MTWRFFPESGKSGSENSSGFPDFAANHNNKNTLKRFYYLIFYLKVIFTHLLHPRKIQISRDANKHIHDIII